MDNTGTHRYDPIQVFECTQQPIPIRVLRVMVSLPLISLEQAENVKSIFRENSRTASGGFRYFP